MSSQNLMIHDKQGAILGVLDEYFLSIYSGGIIPKNLSKHTCGVYKSSKLNFANET